MENLEERTAVTPEEAFRIGDKVQQSWPGEGGQGPIYTVIGFDEREWLILEGGYMVNPKFMAGAG